MQAAEQKIWPFGSSSEPDKSDEYAKLFADAVADLRRYVADADAVLATSDLSGLDASDLRYLLEDNQQAFSNVRRAFSDATTFADDGARGDRRAYDDIAGRVGDLEHALTRQQVEIGRALEKIMPAENDLGGFWAAHAAAMRMTADIDTEIPGVTVQPTVATEDELQRATDILVVAEETLARLPQRLAEIDDAASALNYHFPAPARAGSSPDIARAVEAYDAAVAHLASVRSEIQSAHQLLLSYVSVWSAARAKIEHDLHWQAWAAVNGIEPTSIEREKSRQIEAAA